MEEFRNNLNEKLNSWYIDGKREIFFETPIESRFVCRICENLIVDPIQTERGLIACSKCYNNARELIGDFLCPLDGEKIENCSSFTRPDRYVAREIAKIKVKCFFKECKWTGALFDINNHETTDCEFAKTECDKCNKNILLKDYKQHEIEDCVWRCENCSLEFTDKEEHERICSSSTEYCQYGCGTRFTGGLELDQHAPNCDVLNSGTECPYSELGCKSKDLNESVIDHIQKKHSNFSFPLTIIKKLTNKNKSLITENENNKKMIEIQRKEFEKLQQELNDSRNQIQRMNANFDVKKKEVYDLTKQMDEITTQFEKMNSTDFYEKKLKQLNEMHDQFKSTSSPFQNIQDLEKLSKNTESVRFLEKEQAMLNANLADAELKMQLLENLSTNGHQIWRIDNFRYRVEQAMKGKIVALHSAPCYTSLNGYKFCIRVYPNGDGMGRDTHLSIYFVLMKNHYDNLLEWPFQRKVTFKVLNFRDISRSKKETFITDRNSTSFQKPKKEMNIAAGCPKFLSKELVVNDGFLNDDSIFVETIVEEIDRNQGKE